MFNTAVLVCLTLAAAALGQQIGNYTAESHPSLTVQQCSAWRELYSRSVTAETLSPQIRYHLQQKNIGSRVYLMQDQDNYQMFSLKNQEFTFDVDVSQLPCDGGKAKYSTNKAGALWDWILHSQCPHDIKFINGQVCRPSFSIFADIITYMLTASPNDTNAGTGQYGSCCDEMDIWEANSVSSAYTPHVCTSTGQTRCTGNDCGDGDNRYGGICDKDGCDFNSFRQGVKNFYGPGMTVNTNSKFTLVTQFITADGTANGALSEIRRFYVQNGQVIPNSFSTFTGLTSYNSVSDSYCNAQKTLFGDTNSFEQRGGLNKMGQALQTGMALVLSLWDDHAVNMLWLDSNYPTDADASKPGIARGTCSTSSGKPTDVESQNANAQVTYSNIKFGPLNSTFGH
ncbi:family 7 glycoside hydrolase [Hymenopellis radicata]|nr:family 7 glycoside hydrolase [Hymenopellis radicata]